MDLFVQQGLKVALQAVTQRQPPVCLRVASAEQGDGLGGIEQAAESAGDGGGPGQ